MNKYVLSAVRGIIQGAKMSSAQSKLLNEMKQMKDDGQDFYPHSLTNKKLIKTAESLIKLNLIEDAGKGKWKLKG